MVARSSEGTGVACRHSVGPAATAPLHAAPRGMTRSCVCPPDRMDTTAKSR